MVLKRWRAYLALWEVARSNGISLGAVIREIEEMSREAYDTALREDNQEVLAAWREIPRKGEFPTAVELMLHLAGRLREEQ